MKLNLSVLLLFVLLGVSAQPRITFEKAHHDFGRVGENDGDAVYDFSFTNTGTAPLVIQNVVTTCGCTTPEYTRQPIRPGGTGFIKISYDVKGRPGPIDRNITVYTNSSPPTTNIRISGSVVPVDRLPSEAFRHTVGAIRMEEMHVSFNRMFSYERPALVVRAFNPGPNPASISFINLPAHITAEVSPATIRQGEIATIRVTYDASRKNDWGFVADPINMVLNDNRAQPHRLTVTATIEEDFSRWTATQLQNAPSVTLDRQVIEAGNIRKGERKTFQVRLTNSGRSRLEIRKIDTGGGQILTVNAPREINAGAASDIAVTYDATGQNGSQNRTITLITNDPRNPQITLRFRAEVTD